VALENCGFQQSPLCRDGASRKRLKVPPLPAPSSPRPNRIAVKTQGVVYTPDRIVNAIIRISNIELHHTILEPSCGTGAFIFGLLGHARREFGLRGKRLLNWFLKKVIGIDISKDTIAGLRRRLSRYFKELGCEVPSARFKNIICQDSLLFSEEMDYDVCLGNPPYVRTKYIDPEYLHFLRAKFASCVSGNIDIAYAFVEKFTAMARTLCFVVPNGIIGNTSAKALRQIIQPKLTLLVDFQERLLFSDARTYTCFIKLEKDSEGDSLMYANDLDAELVKTSKKAILAGNSSSDAKPFAGQILRGLCTLCDQVFGATKHGGTFIAECDGRRFPIEEGIVVPALKLTKQRDSDFSAISFMIYPYDQNRKIMAETDLMEKYPLAYAYLCAQRERLRARDRGHGRYEQWYAYGRRQGLHRIAPEVISVPAMIGGDCAAVRLDLSPLLKRYRTVVFTSGFLIPLTDANRDACAAILTPEFGDFLKTNGKPWPGRNAPYYSLSSKGLREFLGMGVESLAVGMRLQLRPATSALISLPPTTVPLALS